MHTLTDTCIQLSCHVNPVIILAERGNTRVDLSTRTHADTHMQGTLNAQIQTIFLSSILQLYKTPTV